MAGNEMSFNLLSFFSVWKHYDRMLIFVQQAHKFQSAFVSLTLPTAARRCPVLMRKFIARRKYIEFRSFFVCLLELLPIAYRQIKFTERGNLLPIIILLPKLGRTFLLFRRHLIRPLPSYEQWPKMYSICCC